MILEYEWIEKSNEIVIYDEIHYFRFRFEGNDQDYYSFYTTKEQDGHTLLVVTLAYYDTFEDLKENSLRVQYENMGLEDNDQIQKWILNEPKHRLRNLLNPYMVR